MHLSLIHSIYWKFIKPQRHNDIRNVPPSHSVSLLNDIHHPISLSSLKQRLCIFAFVVLSFRDESWTNESSCGGNVAGHWHTQRREWEKPNKTRSCSTFPRYVKWLIRKHEKKMFPVDDLRRIFNVISYVSAHSSSPADGLKYCSAAKKPFLSCLHRLRRRAFCRRFKATQCDSMRIPGCIPSFIHCLLQVILWMKRSCNPDEHNC